MSKDDRNAILKRRSRLIQSALVAAGLTVASPGCSEEEPEPQPCLSVPADIEEDTRGGDATSDTATDTTEGDTGGTDSQEDSVQPVDTTPEVCLSPPIDIIEDTQSGQG